MGGHLAPEGDDAGYRRRMEKRQQVQQQRVEERNKEKGLILVFTGPGKGKTTAALGLVLRTLGHGHRVAVVQFIKGGWEPGEARALRAFGDQVAWHALGEGFTWETKDRERDQQLVGEAWTGRQLSAICAIRRFSWWCSTNSMWPSSWVTSM